MSDSGSGSVFSDLCECLVRQFSHQVSTVDGILTAVNGQPVVLSQGFADGSTAFALPPRPTSGISGTGFATVALILLFLAMLMSLRGQIRQAEGGQREPALVKAISASSASGSSDASRRDDHQQDPPVQ